MSDKIKTETDPAASSAVETIVMPPEKCRWCGDPIKENKDGGWGSPPYLHEGNDRDYNHNASPQREYKKGRPATPPKNRNSNEVA